MSIVLEDREFQMRCLYLMAVPRELYFLPTNMNKMLFLSAWVMVVIFGYVRSLEKRTTALLNTDSW